MPRFQKSDFYHPTRHVFWQDINNNEDNYFGESLVADYMDAYIAPVFKLQETLYFIGYLPWRIVKKTNGKYVLKQNILQKVFVC